MTLLTNINMVKSCQVYAFTTSLSKACTSPGSALTMSAARHKFCNDIVGLFFNSAMACIQEQQQL